MPDYTTSDRLKQIMADRDLKQIDILKLAKPYCERYKIKLGRNDLSQYISGKVIPRSNKLYVLGQALNVSEAWLMGYDVPMQPKPKNIFPVDDEYVKIPVVGRVAAGMGCLAEDNIIDYEPISKSSLTQGEDYVFLNVVGDSMYPKFEEGDLVLVRCQTSVDSGSFAVVIIDGEDGVIKKVVYDKNWIELQSINPMYPPRRFEGKDVLRVSVYGLVREIKRKF